MLAHEGPFQGVEIVAQARNAMENLIWLELMDSDPQYGIVFYAMLLDDQNRNQLGFIDKIKAEIDLFEKMEVKDHELFAESVLNPICEKAPRAEDNSVKLMIEHKAKEAELDESVRRQFCLYANSASFNGYGLQAEFCEIKHSPDTRPGLPRLPLRKPDWLQTCRPLLIVQSKRSLRPAGIGRTARVMLEWRPSIGSCTHTPASYCIRPRLT